jgi:DedD protein
MEEKNELNDIILNKGNNSDSNKKIILVVATLGVVFILIVVLVNLFSSDGSTNLPQVQTQTALPPEPKNDSLREYEDEPLFEEVEVIQDESGTNNNLDSIAQRLKQESLNEPKVQTPPKPVQEAPVQVEPKAAVVQSKPAPKPQAPKASAVQSGVYYIQVGSFSKYEPNEKFLKSITDKGFKYSYHKVSSNSQSITKVLVGPFSSEKEARDALKVIRSSIESGAFLTKL